MASWKKGNSKQVLKDVKDWDWCRQKIRGHNIVDGNEYNEPKEYFTGLEHILHIISVLLFTLENNFISLDRLKGVQAC